MSSKGQSAIEYLTTYGWMLLVVGIAGGSVYTVVQDSSQVSKTSGLANADVQVTDFAVTSEGDLQMVVRAAAAEQVRLNEIELVDQENQNLKAVNAEGFTLPVGGSRTVSLSNVQRSENTNTYEVIITYDAGGLNSLQATGTITGPIEIVEVVVERLLASGGEIDSLDIQASLRSSDGNPVCLGESCPSTEGGGDQEYVDRSGDEMTGTLQVDDVEFNCLGNSCSVSTGSLTGNVSNVNNTMDGTLNVTEVKPINAPVCLGGSC
jgi:hypothetical protein